MSSENNTPQVKYDVFVRFRGPDIRRGFLSHLSDTFQRKKINAFVDDKNLKKGQEIWPSLVAAIEGSAISLIIFSPDYASSRWCLEELVKILECKEKYERSVIPVFYDVEPTDVRHQSGSYKNAFAKHESKHNTKVQLWRCALNKSADLSGIESSKFLNDAELVKEICNLVLKRLVKPPVNSKGLVGIDERIATTESWIRKELKNICLIGIWGMGGIGKTTLAEEVFNKLQSEYEGCYFLAHEREESNKQGIICLKEKLFSGLLGYDLKIHTPNSLPEDIVGRICCMKVFIVLDDQNDLDHLQNLLGTLDNYGSGSRIIVTTRDEQVLNANKADEIYRLTELSSSEALQFFNLNAFNKSDLHKEYNELSKKVVNYSKGVPLVLKVLARLLCGKNKEVWESELSKLEKIPPTKVYDKMKLSFDDLDRKEKQIFLDLACFFLKLSTKINVDNLKSLLKDDKSDNSVIFGLERLKDKALISFSEDNIVSMHDSLQEMACEIVRQESIEDSGSRSRLWDPNDIYEVLKNDKVTEAIRSIRIQLTTIRGLKLRPHIFAKMSKLKFLEISREDAYYGFENQLGEGPLFLATELRFLSWDCYPLKSLPQNFSAEKLVILKLQLSKLEKLWDGVKCIVETKLTNLVHLISLNLVSLKGVYLDGSSELKELPDLSKAINLEVLDLSSCESLTTVHPSIFSLAKLEILNLSNCISLTILSSDSHMHSLNYLILDYCKSLTEFSIISKNMEELDLSWTEKMKALPSSFGHQRKLKSLDLTGSGIQRLPSSINNLTQLLHLNLSYCQNLTCEKRPVAVIDQKLKELRGKSISLVKILWDIAAGEATWEEESQFKEQYPFLFSLM
uniref:TMV resistance protein N n=1 Tax=Cajanus cajan TaxID=3821 RepID=A0A151QVH4_CAJCA|nr:TMV resistance protein N [Cajanus cajan]